jgi:hypothetical protein
MLQRTKIPNILLKITIEIYSEKRKVKTSIQLSEEHKLINGVRQDCTLSPTIFKIYMKEIVKLNQIYIKGVTVSISA